MKRQKRITGGIIKIPLDDGFYTFGRICEEPLIAFYDIRSRSNHSLDEIISRPILFRICVYNYAVTRGGWEIIGKAPLEDELLETPKFYKYDSFFKRYEIYSPDGKDLPSTWEECKNLELASVWEPGAVEQRLKDHFDNRPCWYLESEKPDWTFLPIDEFYKQYGYDFKIPN